MKLQKLNFHKQKGDIWRGGNDFCGCEKIDTFILEPSGRRLYNHFQKSVKIYKACHMK